jgi:cytochrome oxidase Cu insertion factor (SCO1/SenC/PrrC family)
VNWVLSSVVIVAMAAALVLGAALSLLIPGGPGLLPNTPMTLTQAGATPTPSGLGTQVDIPIGGPFTLSNAANETVTEASFAGRYMLLFFGFTHCPDICITKLEEISRTLEALGSRSAEITPIFISVDPERDTAKEVADYTAYFDKRILGLTGTADQVFEVAKAYRVYYQKVELEDGNYTVDHSALVYFMGRDGKFRSLFRPDETPEQIAAKILEIMDRESGS